MKEAFYVIFAVILLTIVGILIKIAFFAPTAYDKSIDMAYDVVDQTLDADEAIETYEWFKSQEAFINQCYTNEEIAKEEWEVFKSGLDADTSKWSDFQQREESSLRGSYYALQKLTNKALEDYNAKASMTNKAIFKDNLPSNITRAFIATEKLIGN